VGGGITVVLLDLGLKAPNHQREKRNWKREDDVQSIFGCFCFDNDEKLRRLEYENTMARDSFKGGFGPNREASYIPFKNKRLPWRLEESDGALKPQGSFFFVLFLFF
jgi:hypothetical protein